MAIDPLENAVDSIPPVDSSVETTPVPKVELIAGRNPWLVFLLPLVAYLLCGSFEPSVIPNDKGVIEPHWLGIPVAFYPYLYTLKILISVMLVFWAWPAYPAWRRISPLAIVCGAGGVVIWIALCKLQHGSWLNTQLGFPERPGFNPWNSDFSNNAALLWGYLAIRFTGLALLVPIIEEMFLRGFVMRYPIREDWWNVPFGTFDKTALIAGTAIPVLMHPSEALATVAWFGLIHWLYFRTKNIWDCVFAHGITNFLLGVYVIVREEWWLW